MNHKLRLTDEALRQIEMIGDYIAKGSPENASMAYSHPTADRNFVRCSRTTCRALLA